jgi:protein-tyrosine phosphatase
MAEGLFHMEAKRRGIRGEARSAGVFAAQGMPISDHAAEVLRERGAEAKAASQALTRELIEWADLILTMTASHKRQVIGMFPDAADKTFALKEFAALDGETGALLKEREKLIAELQIKQALNQPVSEEEKNRILEIERQLPNFDIADPIGGDLDEYRRCAAEIEEAVGKAIEKLAGGPGSAAPSPGFSGPDAPAPGTPG